MMLHGRKLLFLSFVLGCMPLHALANEDSCLLDQIKSADDQVTAAQMRAHCAQPQDAIESTDVQRSKANETEGGSLIEKRFAQERATLESRHFLTPHKRNYILPISYVNNPNEEPFESFAGVDPDDELDNEEAKFQISLKVALADGLITERDRLYFAMTTRSFWQVYNSEVSAPFRETNYEPELYWMTPLDLDIFDASLLSVGFVHQSNGRNIPLSRSWNRIYLNFVWEKNNWAFGVKPWWRIPEDDKDDPLDTDGDDNPDIDDFMGHFEFTSAYRRNNHEFGLMWRNNLRSDNKGAVQLDWSFPLGGRLRGYVQFFSGYGESLLDYNASIERLGVGILLTDLL